VADGGRSYSPQLQAAALPLSFCLLRAADGDDGAGDGDKSMLSSASWMQLQRRSVGRALAHVAPVTPAARHGAVLLWLAGSAGCSGVGSITTAAAAAAGGGGGAAAAAAMR